MPHLTRGALVAPARSRRRPRIAPALAIGLSILAAGRIAADDDDDVRRLVKVLGIRAGMTVAEVGAGAGALSVKLASVVGPQGQVLASELGQERLEKLRAVAAGEKAANLVVVESGVRTANLPAACCDAIFMRDVYHHFTEPAAMNASLLQALKPCGRLAVLDFAPRGGQESATVAGRGSGSHGVSRDSTVAELAAAGFEVLPDEHRSGRNYLVVVQRPAASGLPAGAEKTSAQGVPKCPDAR